jgi:putative aldouronate transport system permease protein
MNYKQTLGEKIFNVFNIIILGIVGLVAIYPFIYTLSISLSTQAEAARAGLHLYPREVSFTSYQMVLGNPEILTGYANTLFRTILGTAATLFVTCLTAFPLARKTLPFRSPIMVFILFTMIFSGGMVPMFILIKSLGLYDNRLVYILPGLVSAFNVIIVKNFFQSIPESLYESAMLDGASPWQILRMIYIPLSKPVLATVGLWTAVFHWNSWFDAMLYIESGSKQVMMNLLQRIVLQNNIDLVQKGLANPDVTQFTPETIKAATVVITIIPIVLLYPFVQKYFIKGILIGSVKE